MGTRRCLGRLLGGSSLDMLGGSSFSEWRTLRIGASRGVGSGGRSACSRVVSGEFCGCVLGRRKVNAKLASQRKTRLEQL